jgi:hypothetical protein
MRDANNNAPDYLALLDVDDPDWEAKALAARLDNLRLRLSRLDERDLMRVEAALALVEQPNDAPEDADDDEREYWALMGSLREMLDGVGAWNIILALTYYLGDVLTLYCDECREEIRRDIANMIDNATADALRNAAEAEREEAGAVH